MLGEALWIYDGGKFARSVVSGSKEDGTDPHSITQKQAGLQTRDEAKTFRYALMYGAGDKRLGEIVKPSDEVWTTQQLTKAGSRLRSQFYRNAKDESRLVEGMKSSWKVGAYAKGIDGRKAEILSQHQCLNTHLQMWGAIVMKWATVLAYENLLSAGLLYGPDKDFCLVLHVHDEFQWQIKDTHLDVSKTIISDAFRLAGSLLGLRVPIEGDIGVGKNWAETH
jgi:DNA polymerase I-like protein with 3'-5' exonuclease and polymerase domains